MAIKLAKNCITSVRTVCRSCNSTVGACSSKLKGRLRVLGFLFYLRLIVFFWLPILCQSVHLFACYLCVWLCVFFHRRPRADRLPLCSFATGRQLGHFLPSGNLPSIFVLVFTWVAVVKVKVHTIDIAHLRSEFTTTEALRCGTCSQGIS